MSTAKICHSDIHTSVLLHSLCASACHLLLVPDPRSAEARGRRSRPPTPQTGRRKRRGRRRHSSDEGGSPWHSRTRASAASAGTRAALFGGGRGLLPLRLLQTPLLLPAAAARRPQSPLPDRCPDTRPEGGLRQRAPPFPFPLRPPPSSVPHPSRPGTPTPRPHQASLPATPPSPETPTSSQAPESAAVASRPRAAAPVRRASEPLMQLCILSQRDRGPSPLRVRALHSAPRSPN